MNIVFYFLPIFIMKKILKIFFFSLLALIILYLLRLNFFRVRNTYNNYVDLFFPCRVWENQGEVMDCDMRMRDFRTSGDLVSFSAPQGIATLYIPFSWDKIEIWFSTGLQLPFFRWVYDVAGLNEVKRIWDTDINAFSEERLTQSLEKKMKENFFVSEVSGGYKLVIDKTLPLNTRWSEYPRFVWDNWLSNWGELKGIFVSVYTSEPQKSVELRVR